MSEESASGKTNTGNIRSFTRTKKATPEDAEPIVVTHPCGDVTVAYGWAIHYYPDATFAFVCRNCGTRLTMEELVMDLME